MRLRNRITKATFWTDGALLRWPRDKRFFYKSLWACAEDSCCIEDDMFEVKMTAWASPLDSDITVEMLEAWRDELIADGKLIKYENGGGKTYLYIVDMHRHERPRNPQDPDYPLPPWVTFTAEGAGRARRVQYNHDTTHPSLQSASSIGNTTVQSPSGNRNTSPVLSCPDLSGTVPETHCRVTATARDVIDHLNAKTGKRFSANADKTVRHISARLRDGFTAEDLKAVIDVKCGQWLGKPDMEGYLRPETLFGTKCEGYLNERGVLTRDGVDVRSLEAYDNA